MAAQPKANSFEFVNPYTFLPFKNMEQSQRLQAPLDHSGSSPAGRYSGSIDVRWTTHTPMLLPSCAEEEQWILPGDPTNTHLVRLPGSSIKGAVRSLHEAVFNGCLRVFDSEFLPVNRDGVTAGMFKGWRLGIVVQEAALPCQVMLCKDEVVWVEATSMRRQYEKVDPKLGLPQSGDLIYHRDETRPSPLDRLEVEDMQFLDEVVRPTNEQAASLHWWQSEDVDELSVILVTDTAARKETRKEKWKRDGEHRRTLAGRAFWATAELTRELVDISADALELFDDTCANSRDKTSATNEETQRFRDGNVYDDVSWWPDTEGPYYDKALKVPTGRRIKASGYLHPGMPVWVRRLGENRDGPVGEIKMAAAWRSKPHNSQSVAHRYPESMRACDSVNSMCLTCATLGMVVPDDKQTEKRAPAGHSGHVRFGDAISTGAQSLRQIILAPMSSPRPGSAGMYLMPLDLPYHRDIGDIPTHWGSAVDQGGILRQIRGRKFYWHSDPDVQAAYWSTLTKRSKDAVTRYLARDHHVNRTGPSDRAGMTGEPRILVEPKTTFTQRITFENLDRTAVTALLAAIDPTALARKVTRNEDLDMATHLGGGKPFGLGSVTAECLSAEVWEGGDRYLGGNARPSSEFAVTDQTLSDLKSRCGPIRRSVALLSAVLDPKFLGSDANLVWYPPMGGWNASGPDDGVGSESFDKSFEFYAQNTGIKLKKPVDPYATLPLLDEIVDRKASPRLLNARKQKHQ